MCGRCRGEQKEEWSEVKGEFFFKNTFFWIMCNNGRCPLQLDSLALLANPSCWLCPWRRETWEQNVVFMRSHILRSVQQVLVRAVSLLIFGDFISYVWALACKLAWWAQSLYCVMSHLLLMYSSLGRVWLFPNSW